MSYIILVLILLQIILLQVLVLVIINFVKIGILIYVSQQLSNPSLINGALSDVKQYDYFNITIDSNGEVKETNTI